MFRLLKISILLSWLCIIPACKVSYTLSGASIPEQANTVAVDFFENNAPLANPNFQRIITEGIRDKFIRQTRLKIVNDNADLSFSGIVNRYSIEPLAIGANEVAAKTRLTIGIEVTYVNKFNEEENFTQTFSRFADFDASQVLSTVEDALMTEISEQLVQDVFNRAFLNW